jgi:DNA repair protein RadD
MSAALVVPGAPTPRPYQYEAIENVRKAMRRGHARVVLVMPTGSGKTITGAEVVRSAIQRGKRVIWLAHRTELIDQACATLQRLGLDVGAISPSSAWPAKRSAAIQVASIQTLVARGTVRPPADLIVWDECHHCGESAEEWVALLDAYPMVHVLGLTATPERGDGTGLGPIFGEIVVGITVRQLIAMHDADPSVGLVPCDVIRPDSWLKAGRQSGNPLAQSPLDAYREHACRMQGFLFAPTVSEAEEYARQFSAVGIPSVCVHAKTADDQRSAAIAMFRTGRVKMLMNVFVFTEGTDLPMAQVCILARGAGTAGGFLQMVGRVLRPAPGKSSALLLDLQGVSHVHGMPEDERLYRLTGKAIVRAGQVCKVCSSPMESYPCPQCGYAPEPDLEGNDRGATEITGDPLVKFARKIAEGPEQRWETLVRWLRAAKFRGHKASSVRYKWRHVYQAEVPRDQFDKACAVVGY